MSHTTQSEPVRQATTDQPLTHSAWDRTLTPEERAAALARLFPSLRSICRNSFDSADLQRFARVASSGESHAIRFVLSVYNSNVKWASGNFCVAKAMTVWDAEHQAAFLLWAKNPFTL